MKNFTIIYLLALLFTLCVSENISAQIVISKPNLGFTQACASPSFNDYNVTFTFSPVSGVSASNQFIIELSDENGLFDSPTTVYTSAEGSVTTSPVTFTFSVPTTIAGEAFKVRVKSTSPAATSSSSVAFSAYYKIQDTPFSINNLIATGAYCSSGSYLLTIDNPGDINNDSPLQYPSLTFNWYKETSATTSVFVDSGETLSVSEPGIYFAETNYGTCTSNSYSNRVTITESDSETTSEIISSLGNSYCSNDGPTTLSTISGLSYQWFKDDSEISGATDQTFETNESGTYTVKINLGDCSSSATIDLDNGGFSSSIDVPENTSIEEGETLFATLTTDAINPEFEWYLNDVLIPGEINNSYEATQTGSYKVVVTQTTGCVASNEFIFVITEPFPDVADIPNLISPNGDGINDTWIIPQEYVNGANAEVMILSSRGEIVLQTNDYKNNWPENELNFIDVNPVYYFIIKTTNNQTKKGSITVIK
ncbi:gliding motility-associated C-terminal domain-containing protein [Flaviramulus basaltis]|uniref:Gliding motility-associated C-terminal domain-containing protein n=1 Tax=Flaviramulus basaltis TaxID=369401 RepID=A0A1K2IRI9_9FLAO|nr:gliding motility-associated C-terminal domain-containing protein [Flaviramulus basaltis]SFZ94983.1 gliding motility-associated C-terminal domain-containing protein [Flaviramulus basaltis]